VRSWWPGRPEAELRSSGAGAGCDVADIERVGAAKQGGQHPRLPWVALRQDPRAAEQHLDIVTEAFDLLVDQQHVDAA
jgi:hypothetical protein